MTSGIFFQNALVLALQRYPKLQKQWNSAYMRMSGQGKYGFHRNSADGRIDILLRAMEDETVAMYAKNEKRGTETIFVFDLQSTLSRYWLLSTYEMIRIAKDSDAGKHDVALQALYRRLRLVRVPIAKFEIANDRKITDPIYLEKYGDGPKVEPKAYSAKAKVDYNPVGFVGVETGSVGWLVIDTDNDTSVEIYRRDLSDEFLAIYADAT